mmetsp:Transcript_25027/g.34364  ORF Transcript_25027/g.34364 Transcript_25027/m.34364 type:complete len:227 (+) Transcript_25027:1141-1821(+)
MAECSDRGICNRKTGKCSCFKNFEGSACQRSKCPNDCSGHGRCLSMEQLAQHSNALPLSPGTYEYNLKQTFENSSSITWDAKKIFGCLCDSSWEVGLAANQTQEPEWFGSDCSLRHCPSADNPRTIKDETNCFNVTAKNSNSTGEHGNKCHVDCADQGICDYQTGVCSCFNGQFGSDCSISEALYHQTSVSSSGVSVSSGFFGGNMAFDFVAAAAESGGAQMFSNV